MDISMNSAKNTKPAADKQTLSPSLWNPSMALPMCWESKFALERFSCGERETIGGKDDSFSYIRLLRIRRSLEEVS